MKRLAISSFAVFAAPDAPRPLIDHVLGGVVCLSRTTTSDAWAPEEVRFSYPRPATTAEHERLFRAPLVFGAEAAALVVRSEQLGVRQATANEALSKVLDRYLEGLLADLPRGEGLEADVRRALAPRLCEGEVAAASIARDLAMSTRTLHRRLRVCGTTYRGILDELRREIAVRQLARPERGIGEIAFALGFSEPSAFHRAFRRWTGTTPGSFRH